MLPALVSIIIPTWNEERGLGRTLSDLLRQPGEYEVLVSDGGSTDATAAVVDAYPSVHWLEGERGRARQLDRGAAHARGGLLLFLHADTSLPEGAVAELNRFASSSDRVAGGFPHRYDGGGACIRLAARIHSLRSRLTRTYYGDQAPFVSRALFDQLGGFGDVPVMEDLDFARRVKCLTRPIRMRCPVRNSPRKIEQRGLARSTVDAVRMLACYRLGRYRHLAGHAFFGDSR